MTDAYQVLGALSRALVEPREQMGYTHLGGNVFFSEPWSTTFNNLTVRQIINRVTAHLGAHGGWIFYGTRDQRWFTFHHAPPSPPKDDD